MVGVLSMKWLGWKCRIMDVGAELSLLCKDAALAAMRDEDNQKNPEQTIKQNHFVSVLTNSRR